jgi:ORF6N domain
LGRWPLGLAGESLVSMPKRFAIVPVERIQSRILVIRGHKVMLDSDLAELYRVSTKRLNEQVKRNKGRFPADFMFQLSTEEVQTLRSQSATSNRGRGGRRYRPFVFSEHGAVMLTTVLNSSVAVQASIQVVRAFVKLRELLGTHRELAKKLADLEKRIEGHDEEIMAIFEAIRQLMEPPDKPSKRIGYHTT